MISDKIQGPLSAFVADKRVATPSLNRVERRSLNWCELTHHLTADRLDVPASC